MATKSKKSKVAAEPVTADVMPATTLKLNVIQPNPKPFRPHGAKRINARLSWYERLCKYDGKTVAEFLESVAKDCPSRFVTGKHAGEVEQPAGWLGYFVRTGRLQYGE